MTEIGDNAFLGCGALTSVTIHTKGTVLLVCFQCVDTLLFASKHAEGMSLRCDVICALAYCGGHESSHVIKAHTDSARFNEKMVCGNLCEFVADYLEHGLHGLYGYVGLLNLCEGFVR